MKNTKQIKNNGVVWQDVIRPSQQEELAPLIKEHGFSQEDLEEIFSPTQRSYISEYKDYAFLVLLFPVYDAEKRIIRAEELDVFIMEKTLITIHNNTLKGVDAFFDTLKGNPVLKKHITKEPEDILFKLLETLIKASFPMLEAMSLAINDIEEQIFAGKEKKVVMSLSIIRRNVTDLRRIILMHQHAIHKLESFLQHNKLFALQPTDRHFQKPIAQSQEIWDATSNLKERIEVLQETNDSLLSFRLNEIMRFLTMISVILLPPSLLAGLFGMNTKNPPIVGHIHDFWIIFSIAVLLIIIATYYFNRRGWIK